MGTRVKNEDEHDSTGHHGLPAVNLRHALARYERSPSRATLDEAFGAAAATVAAARGDRALEPADAVEVRRLMVELPDFERLVSIAVHEAEQATHHAARRLWEWFGLTSTPPRWTEAERSGARVVVASACAPLHGRGAAWLRPRLLRLAADRWAGLLASELHRGDESLWRRALGERYDSVRERYAPRTKRKTGSLSELLARDHRPLEALHKRLSKWLAEGREFDGLPAEVEAAFVQTRTPHRLA